MEITTREHYQTVPMKAFSPSVLTTADPSTTQHTDDGKGNVKLLQSSKGTDAANHNAIHTTAAMNTPAEALSKYQNNNNNNSEGEQRVITMSTDRQRSPLRAFLVANCAAVCPSNTHSTPQTPITAHSTDANHQPFNLMAIGFNGNEGSNNNNNNNNNVSESSAVGNGSLSQHNLVAKLNFEETKAVEDHSQQLRPLAYSTSPRCKNAVN